MTLLYIVQVQISCRVLCAKYFENWLRVDRVIATKQWCSFYGPLESQLLIWRHTFKITFARLSMLHMQQFHQLPLARRARVYSSLSIVHSYLMLKVRGRRGTEYDGCNTYLSQHVFWHKITSLILFSWNNMSNKELNWNVIQVVERNSALYRAMH